MEVFLFQTLPIYETQIYLLSEVTLLRTFSIVVKNKDLKLTIKIHNVSRTDSVLVIRSDGAGLVLETL